MLAQRAELLAIVDELRRTNAELEVERARIEPLFEHAPIALLAIDRAARIQCANTAAAALLGAPAERLVDVGRLDAYLALPSIPDFRLFLDVVFATGRGTCEVQLEPLADLPVLLTAVRSGDGPTARCLCAIVDLSGRVTAETERRALEHRVKDLQALDSLHTLAGGVVAKLNNDLTAIALNLDLAAEHVSGAGASALHDALAGVHGATELTNRLWTFTGRRPGERHSIDLAAMVRSVEPLARLAAPDAGVIIDTAATAVEIEGDIGQLSRAVLALVTNATEAEARTIRISLARWELSPADVAAMNLRSDLQPGWYAIIEVEDDGCGMTEQVRRRACEPFFSTRGPGRGMGLAVAQGVARAHHGELVIGSGRDRGTSVRMLLEVAPPSR